MGPSTEAPQPPSPSASEVPAQVVLPLAVDPAVAVAQASTLERLPDPSPAPVRHSRRETLVLAPAKDQSPPPRALPGVGLLCMAAIGLGVIPGPPEGAGAPAGHVYPTGGPCPLRKAIVHVPPAQTGGLD